MLLHEFGPLLFERATSVLYHYTKLESAVDILTNKEFKLASSFAKDEEQLIPGEKNAWKAYYMSTARTPTSAFIRGKALSNQWGVILKLNGDWFNQNGYTVKPVDYFNTDADRKEHEDRVISKEPTIKFDGSDLIESVHILVKSMRPVAQQIMKLLIACKKANIPFFVYDDGNNWLVQNTEKALSNEKVIQSVKDNLDYNNDIPVKHGNDRNTKIIAGAIYNLLKAKQPSDLSQAAIFIFDRYMYHNPEEDMKDLLHQVLNAPNKEYGKRLLQAFRATKLPANQIVKTLTNKWMNFSYMVDTKLPKEYSPFNHFSK